MISKYITYGVLIFGLLMMNIAIHEGKHYWDIKDQEDVEIENVCLLNIPINSEGFNHSGAGGYVKYYYTDEKPESSELKANILAMGITLFIAVICLKYMVENEE